MASVTVKLGDKLVGKFSMKSSPCVVGRDPSNGVHIDNIGVSRQHCQFIYDGSKFYVEDMGSSNGTYLNNQKITRQEVTDGDAVTIGKFILLFEHSALDFLPSYGGGGNAVVDPRKAPQAPAPAGGMLTFQMDAATLREQVSKAGGVAQAASEGVHAQRASDMAKMMSSQQVNYRKNDTDKTMLGTTIRVVGTAIAGALVIIALAMAIIG